LDLSDKKAKSKERLSSRWRVRMHEVIFEADTSAGRIFDIVLLILIISSVFAVMLESVESLEVQFGSILRVIELTFTIIFTLEYTARIISVGRPVKYIFSFLGIIDLLAILPTYLSFFSPGTQFLLVLRTVRLLRVFRIFKLSRYLSEADFLSRALKASRYKITVFLGAVVTLVIISGTVMYLVEGPENGFTSIPQSIYWSIVTLTTVGYGDIAPQTVLGQMLASIIMIMGYGIIAVPPGIVTVEMVNLKNKNQLTTQVCPSCFKEGHDADAVFCKYCGVRI
jgi:voltage-gated potassium channel